MAAVSCSNSAATSALDSIYRMLVPTAVDRRIRAAVFRSARRGAELLRFATIAVDQFGGGPWRQPDIRPILERVTSFHRGMKDAGRDELVPPASERSTCAVPWRNEFSDHAPVGRHRNPIARFNATDITAQVVFQ